MKKLQLHSLSLSLALLGCASPAYAQLMFSQYIDGSSNRKGLEIYNPDVSTVNLADYEIRQFSNGEAIKFNTFALQGSLASKTKFVIGRSELKAAIGDKVNQVAGLSYNGEDALVLLYKGTTIDRFGRVGEQPSNGWGSSVSSMKNSFSRLKKSNDVISIDPKAPFELESEWSKWSDQNAFNGYLGGAVSVLPISSSISCSTADTPIADLQFAPQDQRYMWFEV